ncbi:putative oxidoreductase/Short-chain dehydrogenase [Devosia sp. LC5]|uniref:oxidoreductase n=1 Tax=Devosia sp. LC5 TaxID=1502724 RepID=UPI0004E292F2|nr:oxidoreductase [Devosia sp. LC5]KFC62014.1 putative oxidoreductase/Short-chain dehydrogenase [Devosia sp. LC5]
MRSEPDNQDDRRPPRAARSAFSRRSFLQVSAVGAAAGMVGFGAGRLTGGPAEIPDWTYENIPDQRGRRVIVTGANGYPQEDRSGLGYHQALGLARAGADVTIASRNRERGEEAVRRMRAEVSGATVRFETLDLANLASISAFADRMRASGDRLDLLINSAGVMARQHREVSVDGFERVFATNALGPFALTAQLLPLLRNGNAPRIVWMASSRGHFGELNFDDLQQEKVYDYARAYDDAKLADLLLAFECDRRSRAAGWRISSIAAHPGVARTNIVLDGPGLDSAEGWRFRYIPVMWQDPALGALPLLYAGTSPHAVGGGYYGPKDFQGLRGLPGVATPPPASQDLETANRLWATLEQLGQVSFG